jgi:aminomethyltransferase
VKYRKYLILNIFMPASPLIAEHLAAGAKLIEFAGWQLPLHFGSQIDEHHAVRRDAGLFDISHMLVVDIVGPGAHAFLRRTLANDVYRLGQAGKALYSCMLNDTGGILDDLIVYRMTTDNYRMVLNAATADSDIAWLRKHCPTDISLRPRRDLAMLAVQGPQARAKCWSALPALRDASAQLAPFFGAAVGDIYVARTGYTGEDGFELMLPATQVIGAWKRLRTADVRPCGLGARDTLRLEAGFSLYGQDMDQSVMPAECGLGWTVSISSEREFIGKAALLARTPTCVLLGLILEDRSGVLRAHHKVETIHGTGRVTSGTFAPTLQASIALARLPPASRPGDRVQVIIRDKRVTARVVKPPFVRYGKILV